MVDKIVRRGTDSGCTNVFIVFLNIDNIEYK